MVLIATIFSLLITPLALAQTEEVFSVHVYDCGEKIELLDYKENYDINPEFKYNLGGDSVEEKMELLYSRMKRFEPLRAKMFKSWHNALKPKTRRLEGMDLGKPDDRFSFVNWDGCKVKVLAKGTDPENEGVTLYIDQTLWSRLDNKVKAGAYFNILLNIEHIVYNFQETTMNSRYLNALLASNQLYKITSADKLKLYDLLGYRTVGFYGLGFEFTSFYNGTQFNLQFDENDRVRSGTYSVPMTNLNWTNLDLMPKFLNAPNFRLRYYDGSFSLDQDKFFELGGFLPKDEETCLGQYNLSKITYVKIEATLSEQGKTISKVHGRFKIGEQVYGTIETSDRGFIATTELHSENDIDRAEEVGICHE